MFCPKCGKEIDDRSTFCNHCGTRIVSMSGQIVNTKPNNATPKTPFYKHWLFWVLFVLVIFFYGIEVTSGGSKYNPSPDTGIHNGSESNPSTSTTVSITKQVIYDKDGVTITATGISNTITKTEITLLVENNTDKNIAVGCSDFVVNGITVDGYMHIEVAAGKKANGELSLYNDSLEIAGIKTISTVKTFDAYISDTDTYHKIEYISLSVNTSATGHPQSIDDSGVVLFSQDGITAIAKYISDGLMGKTMIVLVKNNSGQDIIVQADNVSVNGYTLSVLQSDNIPNGSVRFCELYLSNSRLEENGIETIDTITFALEISNASTWDALFKTDELEVRFSD